MESIANDFTSLVTAETHHHLARFSGPNGRLVRWERPFTWSVLGRGGHPPSEYAQLAAMATFGLALHAKVALWARFSAPVVISTTKSTETPSDLMLNRIMSPELDVVIDPSGKDKTIAINFRAQDLVASVEANIAILVGDRRVLLEFAQKLSRYGVSVPTPGQFTSERCVAFVWAGNHSEGIIASVILVDDQVSFFETTGCMVRPLGRVLGISGEIETGSVSAFSLGNDTDVIAWRAFDLSSLGMLYDPAFKSGMSADEVRRIALGLVPKYFPRHFR